MSTTLPPLALGPLAAANGPAIETLLDRAFGPDRRTRTAYRLREGSDPIEALSTAAFDRDGTLLATLQCWDVVLAGAAGPAIPLVLVGPVAVAPEAQGRGIGTRLLDWLLGRAEAEGVAAMMLVGDPDYYGRFGFSADGTGGWGLPGPVERHRLLARTAPGIVLPTTGIVRPAPLPLRRAG